VARKRCGAGPGDQGSGNAFATKGKGGGSLGRWLPWPAGRGARWRPAEDATERESAARSTAMGRAPSTASAPSPAAASAPRSRVARERRREQGWPGRGGGLGGRRRHGCRGGWRGGRRRWAGLGAKHVLPWLSPWMADAAEDGARLPCTHGGAQLNTSQLCSTARQQR
jgi:hypothetical protein